jgi:hypothetical protein
MALSVTMKIKLVKNVSLHMSLPYLASMNVVLLIFPHQAVALVTGNMTVPNNEISQPISSAVFAEMRDIWLVTVRIDNVAPIGVTTVMGVPAAAIVQPVMPLTVKWRYV